MVMNWPMFFAVIAVAGGVGAWIALIYALNGATPRAHLYGLTVVLVLVCATATGLAEGRG